MPKQTKEQKLSAILEVKNERMFDASAELIAAFSILKDFKNNLSGPVPDDQYQSLSDAIIGVTSAFMTLLEAHNVEKYWNLDK